MVIKIVRLFKNQMNPFQSLWIIKWATDKYLRHYQKRRLFLSFVLNLLK